MGHGVFGWTWNGKDRLRALAAFFAPGHDGGVEAVAEAGRHLVELVGAVDLDGFAGRREGDLAMLAALEVLLEVGPHRDGSVVDHVVEQGKKLGAGHFFTPSPRRRRSIL